MGRRRCARGWEVTASHPVSKPHHQTACQPSTHGVRRWLYGWVVMDDGWVDGLVVGRARLGSASAGDTEPPWLGVTFSGRAEPNLS